MVLRFVDVTLPRANLLFPGTNALRAIPGETSRPLAPILIGVVAHDRGRGLFRGLRRRARLLARVLVLAGALVAVIGWRL